MSSDTEKNLGWKGYVLLPLTPQHLTQVRQRSPVTNNMTWEAEYELVICMQEVYCGMFSSLVLVWEVKQEGSDRSLCQHYREFWNWGNPSELSWIGTVVQTFILLLLRMWVDTEKVTWGGSLQLRGTSGGVLTVSSQLLLWAELCPSKRYQGPHPLFLWVWPYLERVFADGQDKLSSVGLNSLWVHSFLRGKFGHRRRHM